MFLEFCAGIAILVSLGVALQLRAIPCPHLLKCFGWLAVLLAIAAVAMTLTSFASKTMAAWSLVAAWLATQIAVQIGRHRWLGRLRADRGR